jgi:hypothetical protein
MILLEGWLVEVAHVAASLILRLAHLNVAAETDEEYLPSSMNII